YPLASVYADLLVKAYTYLKQHEPGQPFVGVVLFADRSLEPTELVPYRLLLDGGLIRPFYLDEMPQLANAPLGLSILYLIQQAESQAPLSARVLISRAKAEIGDAETRADLIELIETVIIYKLPRLSREEIQAMLQIHEIRESRVFQEALGEGIEKGIALAITRMAADKLSSEEIARILKIDSEKV